MALILCSECEAKISSKAVACPKCGNPGPFIIPEEKVRCNDCKELIPEGSNSCPECGNPDLPNLQLEKDNQAGLKEKLKAKFIPPSDIKGKKQFFLEKYQDIISKDNVRGLKALLKEHHFLVSERPDFILTQKCCSINVAQCLVDHGLDINFIGRNGTILQSALNQIESSWDRSSEVKRVVYLRELCKLLIKKGVSIELDYSSYKSIYSPIPYIILLGELELFSLCLEQGFETKKVHKTIRVEGEPHSIIKRSCGMSKSPDGNMNKDLRSKFLSEYEKRYKVSFWDKLS